MGVADPEFFGGWVSVENGHLRPRLDVCFLAETNQFRVIRAFDLRKGFLVESMDSSIGRFENNHSIVAFSPVELKEQGLKDAVIENKIENFSFEMKSIFDDNFVLKGVKVGNRQLLAFARENFGEITDLQVGELSISEDPMSPMMRGSCGTGVTERKVLNFDEVGTFTYDSCAGGSNGAMDVKLLVPIELKIEWSTGNRVPEAMRGKVTTFSGRQKVAEHFADLNCFKRFCSGFRFSIDGFDGVLFTGESQEGFFGGEGLAATRATPQSEWVIKSSSADQPAFSQTREQLVQLLNHDFSLTELLKKLEAQ